MSGHFPSNAIKNSPQWPSDTKFSSIKKPDFYPTEHKKSAVFSGGNNSGFITRGMASSSTAVMSFESLDQQHFSPTKTFGKTPSTPSSFNGPSGKSALIATPPSDYIEINPTQKVWNAASLQQQKQLQQQQQQPATTAKTVVSTHAVTTTQSTIEGNATPIPSSSSSFLLKVNPASNIEEELTGQNLYKTELCRSFEETGTCRYGTKCQFAHGKTEQRPVMRHPKYKTEVCKTFHTIGTCPYGKRCRFIHNLPDGSPAPVEPEDSDIPEPTPQQLKAQMKAATLQNAFSSNPNEWSTSWKPNSAAPVTAKSTTTSTTTTSTSSTSSTTTTTTIMNGFSSSFQSAVSAKGSQAFSSVPSSAAVVPSQILTPKQLKQQMQNAQAPSIESAEVDHQSQVNSTSAIPQSSSYAIIPKDGERSSRLACFNRFTSEDQDS